MLIRYLLDRVLVILFLLLSTVSLFLQEAGLQYVLALFLIIVGISAFLLAKNKAIGFIDVGWLFCAVMALVYIAFALMDGRDAPIVVWQGLMFLMPFTQYLVRFTKINLSADLIIKLLLVACILKIPTFFLNFEEVLASFVSLSGRVRFHDFSSIVLIFLLFPALLYMRGMSRRSQILIAGFLALFIITAAHRSAYLAIIAQFLFWFFMYSGASTLLKYRLVIIGVAVSVGFLMLTSSGAVMLELFINSSKGIDGNANARVDLSSAVLSDWLVYFWGHGLGFEYMYGVDARGDSVFYALQHNSYLTPYYYIGVIPALLFLVSLIYLAFMPVKGHVSIYLRSVLTGMGVFAYFNLWFENPLFAIPYWLVFGWFKFSLNRERS